MESQKSVEPFVKKDTNVEILKDSKEIHVRRESKTSLIESKRNSITKEHTSRKNLFRRESSLLKKESNPIHVNDGERNETESVISNKVETPRIFTSFKPEEPIKR